MLREKILFMNDGRLGCCHDSLSQAGFQVKTARTASDAINLLNQETFDLLLTDLKLDGLEVLKESLNRNPEGAVIVMTTYGSILDAVMALKKGASAYLTKPFTPDHLLIVIEKVIRNLHLAGENRMLKTQHEEGIKFDLPFKEAKEVTIEGFERKYILGLLSRHNGNISRAAEGSGIDRRSLHRLLAKHHIDASRFS